MISFNGEIKLMDFGIAKAASRSTKTVAGTVKGKCAYMSPEQARGKPLDGRSDLFGLAVVLWEMLTHKRLFLGNSDFVTLSNVLKQEAPAPSSINPNVPKELDDIVLKALAKDRDERQATVEQFARDLTKWFYATVDDLDSVALGPVMKELFTEDLEQLSKWSNEENEMLAQAHSEASSSRKVEAVSNEDATVAVAAADFDPHSAKTLMEGNLSADEVKQALAKQQADSGEATVALSIDPKSVPNTATGTAALAGSTGTHATGGGSKRWIIIAVLLLVGGGIAAAVFMGGGDDAGKKGGSATVKNDRAAGKSGKGAEGSVGNEGTLDPNTAKAPPEVAPVTMTLVAEPSDAVLEYDGATKSETGNYIKKAKPGTKFVVTISSKDGKEKRLQEVLVKEGGGLFTVKLSKPKPASLRIKPDPADAAVFANNAPVAKNANGFYIVEGTEGASITVFIRDSKGKESELKQITLKAGAQTATVSLGPASATLKVQCDPADAKVTIVSGNGTVTAASDHSMIAGEKLVEGSTVRVDCRKEGYIRKASRVITLKAGENVVPLKMVKVGDAPVATGNLRVNSYPYAK